MSGPVGFLVFFLTYAVVYGILAIGLNIQWGFTGLVNFGVAGFFAVGAYISAFMTGGPSPYHLGGFGVPFPVALLIAMVVSGLFALILGIPVIRLREDYLAIVTIGFAEIVRLVIVTERNITKGPYGMGVIKPYKDVIPSAFYGLFYLLVSLAILAIIYLAIERAVGSPWGRVDSSSAGNSTSVTSPGSTTRHSVLGISSAVWMRSWVSSGVGPEKVQAMRPSVSSPSGAGATSSVKPRNGPISTPAARSPARRRNT